MERVWQQTASASLAAGEGTYNNMPEFSASGNGTVTVHFTNDAGSPDVQIDYVTIGGVKCQTEKSGNQHQRVDEQYRWRIKQRVAELQPCLCCGFGKRWSTVRNRI